MFPCQIRFHVNIKRPLFLGWWSGMVYANGSFILYKEVDCIPTIKWKNKYKCLSWLHWRRCWRVSWCRGIGDEVIDCLVVDDDKRMGTKTWWHCCWAWLDKWANIVVVDNEIESAACLSLSLFIPDHLTMQRKTLWGSYKALPPRTRVWIGIGESLTRDWLGAWWLTALYLILGGMAFATYGMLVSDYIEQQFPASDKEKQQAEAMSPIVVVDHKDK